MEELLNSWFEKANSIYQLMRDVGGSRHPYFWTEEEWKTHRAYQNQYLMLSKCIKELKETLEKK